MTTWLTKPFITSFWMRTRRCTPRWRTMLPSMCSTQTPRGTELPQGICRCGFYLSAVASEKAVPCAGTLSLPVAGTTLSVRLEEKRQAPMVHRQEGNHHLGNLINAKKNGDHPTMKPIRSWLIVHYEFFHEQQRGT